MKKVILALAIVSVSFAACNDSSKTEEPKADTTTVVTPAPDTTVVVTPDTTKPATPADTTKK